MRQVLFSLIKVGCNVEISYTQTSNQHARFEAYGLCGLLENALRLLDVQNITFYAKHIDLL